MNSVGFSTLWALVMMSYLGYLHYFLQFLFLLYVSVTSEIILSILLSGGQQLYVWQFHLKKPF